MSYAIYLRKSRADMDAEAQGAGETLARHRTALLELAQKRALPIGAIYEEIVSGDTIAARPQMQRLLAEVESGSWEGVIVMEVERLARGETIDQGIVAQAFKYSGALIITPTKTYDPNNEFDEEYFEFGLFMSRREYKAINRRLQAGRRASAKEGKWLGGPAPYGYDSCKLPQEKGYSLIPNKDADTIRAVFRLYVSEPGMGTIRVSNRLNELGYRSATGKPFNVGIIKEILRNPLYAGYITYGRRTVKKQLRDGAVVHKYPRAKEYPMYKGRHEPLVTEEVWQAAQAKLAARSFHPVRHDKQLQNPFAGILVCGGCGHKIQARPGPNGTRVLFCHHYCGMVSARLDEAEQVLAQALAVWLADYTAQSRARQPAEEAGRAAAEETLAHAQRELDAVNGQLSNAFEFLERGIYTPEVFAARRQVLLPRQEASAQAVRRCQAEVRRCRLQAAARLELAPKIARAAKTYGSLSTPEEKNGLLKSVIHHITYRKTRPSAHPDGSDLTLTLYPIFPEANE